MKALHSSSPTPRFPSSSLFLFLFLSLDFNKQAMPNWLSLHRTSTTHLVTLASVAAVATFRLLSTTTPASMPVIKPGVVNDQAYIRGKTKEQLFDFLANFDNIASWDPGCLSSKRVDEGPLKVGSTFDLVTVFKGQESQMTYVPPFFPRFCGQKARYDFGKEGERASQGGEGASGWETNIMIQLFISFFAFERKPPCAGTSW